MWEYVGAGGENEKCLQYFDLKKSRRKGIFGIKGRWVE
jgi:hypothetical protein